VAIETETRFLMLAGKPLGEPIVQYGPIVMNTRKQIEQVVHDNQRGKLVLRQEEAQRLKLLQQDWCLGHIAEWARLSVWYRRKTIDVGRGIVKKRGALPGRAILRGALERIPQNTIRTG